MSSRVTETQQRVLTYADKLPCKCLQLLVCVSDDGNMTREEKGKLAKDTCPISFPVHACLSVYVGSKPC